MRRRPRFRRLLECAGALVADFCWGREGGKRRHARPAEAGGRRCTKRLRGDNSAPLVCSIVVPAAAPVLAGEINFGVDDAHVPSQCVVARKGLLFDAQRASHLLLSCVMNCVLVACQIVRS